MITFQLNVFRKWLGFGPEQLSIPSNFVIPVSSFGMYGGHASIHIRYDEKDLNPTYKSGSDTSKQSVAYLQVAVPTYRISQMVKNGGNILDAYGFVNVITPSGLPMRTIIGIRPDPIMFVAIHCQDVQESKAFYNQLGFVEQPYPFARPSNGKGQFEPPQPENSVYLAPSAHSMGVLLLQNKNKRQKVQPNPSVKSLQIVFAPSSAAASSSTDADKGNDQAPALVDPSGVRISFVSVDEFEREEKLTRF